MPHPVIYEVNLTVDVEVVEAFDEWLHDHTQDMLAIPGFISATPRFHPKLNNPSIFNSF